MKYLIVSGGEVKEGFLTWIVKNGGFDVILAADAGIGSIVSGSYSAGYHSGGF